MRRHLSDLADGLLVLFVLFGALFGFISIFAKG